MITMVRTRLSLRHGPSGRDTPEGQLDLIEDRLVRLWGNADTEIQYRTALRLYLDQWLAATAAGEEAPVVRAGRRQRWFEQSLEPLRSVTDTVSWERTVAALCLLCGPEARTVLRDVCGLDEATAREVVRFAAEVLLDAGLR